MSYSPSPRYHQSLLLLAATVVVVKLKDAPILCRTDEVGEICVHSTASASSYYRLQGRTAHTFQVRRREGSLSCGTGCAVYVHTYVHAYVGGCGVVLDCWCLPCFELYCAWM